MGGDLFRDQVAPGNLKLFLLRIAGKLDRFHPIPQCRLYWVLQICCCHKQHAAQVEGDPQIIVAKGIVLLGVEHFQKSRRRVPTKIRADLLELQDSLESTDVDWP
jgi:hypothetical protein